MSNVLTNKKLFWAAILLNLLTIGIVISQLISGAWIAAFFLIFYITTEFFDILAQLFLIGLISLILLISVLIFARGQDKFARTFSLITALYGFLTSMYLSYVIWGNRI